MSKPFFYLGGAERVALPLALPAKGHCPLETCFCARYVNANFVHISQGKYQYIAWLDSIVTVLPKYAHLTRPRKRIKPAFMQPLFFFSHGATANPRTFKMVQKPYTVACFPIPYIKFRIKPFSKGLRGVGGAPPCSLRGNAVCKAWGRALSLAKSA